MQVPDGHLDVMQMFEFARAANVECNGGAAYLPCGLMRPWCTTRVNFAPQWNGADPCQNQARKICEAPFQYV